MPATARPTLGFGVGALLGQLSELFENRLRALLDAAPDGILITGADGQILLANQEACALFGYTEPELWSLGVDALVPDSMRSEHAQRRAGYQQDPSRRPMGIGLSLSGRRKDGTEFPVEVSLSTLDSDGGQVTMAIIRSLGPRLLLEEALRQRADLVEMASDAIVLLELNTRLILEWNPGAERLYGWTRAEALGQRSDQLLWPTEELEAYAQQIIGELLKSNSWEGNLRLVRKGGQQIVVRTRLNMRQVEIGRLLVLSVSHDYTLELQANEARVARERAEAALIARDDFLSIAAHELKTPLTSLQGFAQLLDAEMQTETPNPARVKRALKAILEQTQRLTRLSSQLLDVSRLSGSAADVLRLERVDLALLANNACARARARWPALLLDCRTPPQLLHKLDEGRMEQVLTNLIENAAKFAGSTVIEVILEQLPGQVRLSVSDHGAGIAAELRERVFERAFQLDPHSSASGMGLGLYICRQLVELHGGRIWAGARSDAQPGARLVIELPS